MYKLYWSPMTLAFAPQAVLEEGGLEYEIVRVNMGEKEHREPSYLSINPSGLIPAMACPDGMVLTETGAICLFLIDTHGLTELAPPATPENTGRFYQGLFQITTTIQESYRCLFHPERFSADEADFPRINEKALETLNERWQLIDNHLSENGPFWLGERFSFVDVYTTMFSTWYKDPAELFRLYPAVKRCFDATTSRPAIAKTLAAHGWQG